jgi:DNA-binding CsgD family transcriptional regulator
MHKEPDDPQWLLDFDRALARTSDPDTSHEAAEKINVTKRQKEVLRTLSGKRLTASEIADLMRLNRDSVSPRMKPLER